MMKILFPFETGCECYREAYVYAVKLARNLGAELILLNAFDMQADDTLTMKHYDLKIKASWIKAYREIILFHDYYLSDHARVDSELRIKTDHRIIHGKLPDEFQRVLHDETIDLIVLPVSGGNETTSRTLQHLRRKAIESVRTSLMVTPTDRPFLPMKDILFAFGLKRNREINASLGELAKLSGIYGSNLHLAILDKHLSPDRIPGEELITSLRSLHQFQSEIEIHEITGRDIEQKMLQFISDHHINLLALARPQLHLMNELLRKNIFDEICLGCGIPVVVMK